MKYCRRITLFTACMSFGVLLLAQQEFTIESAIEYAVANSLSMKAEEFSVADAEAQIQEYKSIGLPQVNGSVSYQHFLAIPTQILPDFLSPAVDGRLLTYNLIDAQQISNEQGPGVPAQFGTKNNLTVGAEASMLLFDGSYLVGLKAVKVSRELAQRQKAATKRDVENNVLRAYLAVLQAEKNQGIIRDNIENLEKTHRETRIIYENGFAEKLDVERLQLSLENLNRELEKIVQIVELTKNVLKFQMMYPLDQDIVLTEDFDRLVELALVQTNQQVAVDPSLRPEYQLLNTTESLYQLNIDRYKKGYLPTLRGFASYSTGVQRNDLFDSNENGWFPTSVVGMTVNVPIFDGFDKRSKIQRAQITLEKNALQKRQFEQALNMEVTNARIALENAKASLRNTESTLALAEKIVNTTRIKFREGVGSSIEIIQGERELYAAQGNHINAQYDLVAALKDLEIALGK